MNEKPCDDHYQEIERTKLTYQSTLIWLLMFAHESVSWLASR